MCEGGQQRLRDDVLMMLFFIESQCVSCCCCHCMCVRIGAEMKFLNVRGLAVKVVCLRAEKSIDWMPSAARCVVVASVALALGSARRGGGARAVCFDRHSCGASQAPIMLD